MNNLVKVGYSCPPSGKACIYIDDKTAGVFGSNFNRLPPTGKNLRSNQNVHNNPKVEFSYNPESRTLAVGIATYQSKLPSMGITVNNSEMWPWRAQAYKKINMPLSGLTVLNATLSDNELIIRIPPDSELPVATKRVTGRHRRKKKGDVAVELRDALSRFKLALRLVPGAKLYGDVKENADVRPFCPPDVLDRHMNMPLEPDTLHITMIKKVVVETEEEVEV